MKRSRTESCLKLHLAASTSNGEDIIQNIAAIYKALHTLAAPYIHAPLDVYKTQQNLLVSIKFGCLPKTSRVPDVLFRIMQSMHLHRSPAQDQLCSSQTTTVKLSVFSYLNHTESHTCDLQSLDKS